MNKYKVPMTLTNVNDKNATFAYAEHTNTINVHLMSRELWNTIGRPHEVMIRIENND